MRSRRIVNRLQLKVGPNAQRRAVSLILLIITLVIASTSMRADTGTCGGQMITLPFTDVPSSNTFICAIAGAYFSGLTNGTTATTYSPSTNVTREQMAAFVTRTLDQSLRRGNRRAALNQWDQGTFSAGGMTTVGVNPGQVASDGEDLWVASLFAGTVSRIHASDGRLLETWTGAANAHGVLVARGRIFITGVANPGKLYRIDPRQAPGDVEVVTSSLGDSPWGITTDGDFIWVAGNGTVSKVNPGNGNVQTYGGFPQANGILYDGSNVWVTLNSDGDNNLRKLNSDGTVASTFTVGDGPLYPVFDGMNIWVPCARDDSVTVLRVKDSQGNPLAQPFVLTTLTGNGLGGPISAAFDGQRILITNFEVDSASLWRATDFSPLGSFNAGAASDPWGACSDGVNFWVTLSGTEKLARF